ncbi:MAG: hypothetical protein ACREJC_01475 [Tepidisphaeraceae bacterium]
MPRRSDPRIELLLDMLDRSFDKPGWQGPNLANSFRGVSAQDAARRLPGRKGIWEQLLHTAYWKQRVINLLIGTQKFPRAGSNWPKLPEKITNRAWKEDQALLHEIHRNLRRAVASIPARELDDRRARLIFGSACHDMYHAGQVRLLRKMQSGR